MALQNRVLPTGEIVADPARGLLMGNRGCLHRADRTLGAARWRSPMWICCVLDWKGVQRDVMPPGRWTALFFLDEATALAAGHRPCGYCRRDDFLAFAEHWRAARGLAERPKAVEMDRQLHAERVEPRTRRKLTWRSREADLPDGAMVRHEGELALVWEAQLRLWAPAGYSAPKPLQAAPVEVLTPPSTVAVLADGYRPLLHPSALA